MKQVDHLFFFSFKFFAFVCVTPPFDRLKERRSIWPLNGDFYFVNERLSFVNKYHTCRCFAPTQSTPLQSCLGLVQCATSPMNDGSALPTLQVNERGSGGAGYGSLCVALGKEQLTQNELRYVARGARFGDNISTLRDGMRCTEGTLTFCCPVKRSWQHFTRLTSSPAESGMLTCLAGERVRNSVRKSGYFTFARFSPNIFASMCVKRVLSRKLASRHWIRHTCDVWLNASDSLIQNLKLFCPRY